MTWLHTKGKAWTFDQAFRQLVADMIKSVTDRADIMACRQERDKVCLFPLHNLLGCLPYCSDNRKSAIHPESERYAGPADDHQPHLRRYESDAADEDGRALRALVLNVYFAVALL